MAAPCTLVKASIVRAIIALMMERASGDLLQDDGHLRTERFLSLHHGRNELEQNQVRMKRDLVLVRLLFNDECDK